MGTWPVLKQFLLQFLQVPLFSLKHETFSGYEPGQVQSTEQLFRQVAKMSHCSFDKESWEIPQEVVSTSTVYGHNTLLIFCRHALSKSQIPFYFPIPFAPFPLQKLHHYYGLVCHYIHYRYSASRLCLLYISLIICMQLPKFRK